MKKTLQDILNGIANNMIANATLYLSYRNIGRDTSTITNNLRLLYNLYWAFPYFSQTNPDYDIERAQEIINLTTAPE